MYRKNTWLPRLGTGLNKFKNTGDMQNLILTPTPDSVIQTGTPFSADLMNELEQNALDGQLLAGGIQLDLKAGAGEIIEPGDVVGVVDGELYNCTTKMLPGEEYEVSDRRWACKLSDGRIAVVFYDPNVSAICARIAAADPLVSFESPVGQISQDYPVSIRCIGVGDYLLIAACINSTAGLTTGIGRLYLCSIAENSFEIISSCDFSPACERNFGLCAMGTDNVVIVYRDEQTEDYAGIAVCASIVEDTVTIGEAYVFCENAAMYPHCSKITDGSFLLAYTNISGYVTAVIGSILDRSISFGDAISVNSEVSIFCNTGVLSDNTAVVIFQTKRTDSDTEYSVIPQIAILEINGTAVEFTGSPQILPAITGTSENTTTLVHLTVMNSNHIAVSANDYSNDGNAVIYSINIANGSITICDTVNYDELAVGGAALIPITERSAVVFYGYTGSTYTVTFPFDKAFPQAIALSNVDNTIAAAFSGVAYCPRMRVGDYIGSNGVCAFCFADDYIAVTGWWKNYKESFTDSSIINLTPGYKEYLASEPISSLTLVYPISSFDIWMRFTTVDDGTVTITLPASEYIGATPDFGNGETWEISIKDGVVIAALCE